MIRAVSRFRQAMLLLPVILFGHGCAVRDADRPVVVGSKKFTESVVLGEIATQLARSAGASANHQAELGGTRILWGALKTGDIDAYPEYTGTLRQEIFPEAANSEEALRAELGEMGLRMTAPLGFNNTYALGMLETEAERLGIRKISDLPGHPRLRVGLTPEFLDRRDGWPGLRKAYRLPHQRVRGLDHDIAYRALQSGDIQIMDLYSTDAEIRYYGIRVLEDDRAYFPRYDAVFLYRDDLVERAPRAAEALEALGGRIDEKRMIGLNARAKLDQVPATRLAAEFAGLSEGSATESAAGEPGILARVAKPLREHLSLVLRSLVPAILVAIPLGILAARSAWAGQLILGIVSTIQTVPALALLVVLIRPLNALGFRGIGDTPALVALFLYSLLPIVRNTQAGLLQIAPGLRESALALGLSSRSRLRRIELPLALPLILAGIKTATVINVGFATLGALVGAGGLGQSILTGIRLDNYSLILQGAVPAAALALLVQWVFERLERRVVPRGLRLGAKNPGGS